MMRLAITMLVACTLATAARADAPVPAKARALAQEGMAAHAAGDYPRAIAAFTAAYVIAPSGALLFDLAQAYRLSNDCDDAVLMYRRFLATDPDPTAAEIARMHLATVERCARTEPSAQLAHPTPTASRRLASPPRPITVNRIAPPPPETHHALAIGLSVAGSAALGIALIYGVDAHTASNDIEAAYTRGAAWRDLAPTDARGKHDERAAVVFGIGGALAIGAAVAVHAYDRRARREQPQISLTPAHGGAHVGVSWAF